MSFSLRWYNQVNGWCRIMRLRMNVELVADFMELIVKPFEIFLGGYVCNELVE